jgi:16S rRNA (guanine(966)-N(2))-methyltransferase RsmD
VRVIAGSLKGRTLLSPTWDGLRPTSDRLRETLFNVLSTRVAGARFLDGYAGTGAVGIEALSRGAAHVTFLEKDSRAERLIGRNLARCGIADAYAIIRAPFERSFDTLRRSPSSVPFDIVFLDPPYDMSAEGVLTGVDALVSDRSLVVLEHAKRQAPPEAVGRLTRTRDLVSGDSALTFYACQP